MIDIYTIRYGREHAAVYAYPSGGVGITVSDPVLADAVGGVRTLVDGIGAGQAQVLAQRLGDLIAYLTDGEIEYSGVPTDSEDVD